MQPTAALLDFIILRALGDMRCNASLCSNLNHKSPLTAQYIYRTLSLWTIVIYILPYVKP
jgi:hypothetical protein